MQDPRIEVRLRDGTLVLGKLHTCEGNTEPTAKQYTNRTQCWRAAQKEGGTVIQRGRPFYVQLPETKA